MSAQINELVTLAKSGNAEAFGELYEIYYKEMYYYACCVTGSSELAQDAVSEAVLAAFRQIASLKKTEAFKGWLFKILCASCKRHYTENQYKKTFISIDGDGQADNELATSDDLDISLDIKRALSALAEDEREIVLLSTVSGYKSREIAEILGYNAATVRSKLRRALEKMKNMLEETEKKGG